MTGSLIALAAAAVLQPAAPVPLAGLWEGTLGTQPVRVCFVEDDIGTHGAYYDMAQLRLLQLSQVAGEANSFGEGPTDGALWRITQASAMELSGRWSEGQRSMALRLRRLASPEGEESPCASLAFHRPRLAGIRTVSTRATTDGTEFTSLTLDTNQRFEIRVQTFALDGSGAAIQRINATLGAPLAGDPPRWFGCITESLQTGGLEGNYEEQLVPLMISRRWLSVRDQQGGYCGGAHPDASSTYRIFDLTTGAEIDLHGWFNATAMRRERVEGVDEALNTMLPPLRDFILRTWQPQEAECGEVVRTADGWTIGLTRDGFIFGPQLAHAVAACEEEWTYGFDQLRPFLTPEALAQIGALLAERP